MKSDSAQNTNPVDSDVSIYRLCGLLFTVAGVIFLLDQWIKTGWVSLIVLPAGGLIALGLGVRRKVTGLVIAGAIISGLGGSVFFLFSSQLVIPFEQRIGAALICHSLSWFAIFLLSFIFKGNKAYYWALIPAAIVGGGGIPFVAGQLNVLTFIFFIVTPLGAAFLGWGSARKIFGLMIPGCILLGIGPGIYFAWEKTGDFNGLTETGTMLVWFALGWGLITIFSRLITSGFVWWPLIPGGLLAVVGWGLFVGGDPRNGLSFVSNTGSIGLIIFGIYLLLLRRGFRR